MLRGKTGLASGGIYFATSPSDTHHKAHHKGVILSVKVRLGRVKTISPSGDRSITFTSLKEEGYDSVKIPRSGGTEYVVYNYDQCSKIRDISSRPRKEKPSTNRPRKEKPSTISVDSRFVIPKRREPSWTL
jgi:hypothetical protein